MYMDPQFELGTIIRLFWNFQTNSSTVKHPYTATLAKTVWLNGTCQIISKSFNFTIRTVAGNVKLARPDFELRVSLVEYYQIRSDHNWYPSKMAAL